MKAMRIRTRLTIAFLIIVVLMTIVMLVISEQQKIMKHSFLIMEDVDKIELYLLECRRQEKNFLLRQDDSSISLYDSNWVELIYTSQQFKLEIKDNSLISKIESLENRAIQYGDVFHRVIKNYSGDYNIQSDSSDINQLIQQTVVNARNCHLLINEIKNYVFTRFERANITARMVSITSIIIGLMLSIFVIYYLTNSTVKPLERLRELAEKASTGDIQDIDVASSDLEMKYFSSKETFDLATSIQRMVTNLRYLVSSERGLMDDYHMTIVVLINKAIGPAGWSIIEKARTSAGFSSFSEVNASNIAKFISNLQKESIKLIPEERVQLLIKAIKRLSE